MRINKIEHFANFKVRIIPSQVTYTYFTIIMNLYSYINRLEYQFNQQVYLSIEI